MNKFHLSNFGLFPQKGGVKQEKKSITLDNGWKVYNIPKLEDDQFVREYVNRFLNRIVAVEMPTSLECNLRCKYCYIRNPMYKSIHIRSNQVEKVLDAIFESLPAFMEPNKNSKNPRWRELYLTPWGAEALVNLDTMDTLYDYIEQKLKTGYKIETHFSTNATIWNDRIKKMFERLFDLGIIKEIQISLDGPPEIQNKYRPHINPKMNSFDLVKEFTIRLNELIKEKQANAITHFSSTVYADDEDFIANLSKIVDFFTTPNKWFTAIPYVPARIAWEQFSEKTVDKFVEANIQSIRLLYTKFKKFGIRAIDFYTAKLFFNSIRTKNGFYYCSAANTQIGIDFDGSMFPCHGPITSPEQKSLFYIGNVFEKSIDYSGLIRVTEAQWADHAFNAKCQDCPIYKYSPGSLAFTCPTHSLMYSPSEYDKNIFKCISLLKIFPYIVSLVEALTEKKIEYIPDEYRAELTELEDYNFLYENEKINKPPLALNRIQVDNMKFNGFIYNSLMNLYMVPFARAYQAASKPYITSWWDFDDYFNMTKEEKMRKKKKNK